MHELEYPSNQITSRLSRFISLVPMALVLALALPGYSDEAIKEKISLLSPYKALEDRFLEIEQQLARLEARKDPPPDKTALVVELNREIIRLTINGVLELPPGFNGSYVVSVAMDSKKIEVFQTSYFITT